MRGMSQNKQSMLVVESKEIPKDRQLSNCKTVTVGATLNHSRKRVIKTNACKSNVTESDFCFERISSTQLPWRYPKNPGFHLEITSFCT